MNQPIIVYNGQRVLTTQQLGVFYKTEESYIRKNFERNDNHYILGEDYYLLQGEELKKFKDDYFQQTKVIEGSPKFDATPTKGSRQIDATLVEESRQIIAIDDDEKGVHNMHTLDFERSLKFASILILWTEGGCLLHAKSLNTPEAWDVFLILRRSYFQVQRIQSQQSAFADTMMTSFPAPASYAEVQRWERYIQDIKAIYYPQKAIKKLTKEEKEAQKLLAAQSTEDEFFQSEIMRHIERITERGQEWITANGLRGYMKTKTRQEIEDKLKNLEKLGMLEGQKTSQSIKYRLIRSS